VKERAVVVGEYGGRPEVQGSGRTGPSVAVVWLRRWTRGYRSGVEPGL